MKKISFYNFFFKLIMDTVLIYNNFFSKLEFSSFEVNQKNNFTFKLIKASVKIKN